MLFVQGKDRFKGLLSSIKDKISKQSAKKCTCHGFLCGCCFEKKLLYHKISGNKKNY